MQREETLKQIVEECVAFAPAFRKYFMTIETPEGAGRMTSQECLALFVLLGDERSMPMNKLSAALGISKQQTTRLADGLANAGYIDRTVNPDSRREVLVCLTDAGREVIDSIVRLKLTRMLELTARLSDEGISDMLEHVRVMRRVFSGTDEVR